MAHHTRTRVNLAAWASGAVSPTEFDNLDANGFKSINGDDGGVWAPASPIELGGSGLKMTGPFEADGATTLDGDVEINGLLTVNSATAEFQGNVVLGNGGGDTLTINATTTIAGDLTVTSGTVEFHGNVRLGNGAGDAITVDGTSTFNANATFNGTTTQVNGNTVLGNTAGDTLTVNAVSTFEGNAVANGTFEFNGDVAFDGDVDFSASGLILGAPTLGVRIRYIDSGRVPWRTPVSAADTAVTLSVTESDLYWIDGAIVTAERHWTISDTGAVDGDRFICARKAGGTGSILVKSPGGSDLGSIGTDGGTVIVARVAGSWRFVMQTSLD